jgi:hypothetical protein
MFFSLTILGKSTGSPTEPGLKIDADTVLKFVANHPK